MSLYRVKQFIWALKAMRENIDVEYVNKYLNTNEKELFNKLKKTDKQHCIRVSKDAVKYSKVANISTHRVAKVALLHDIGKGYYGLNIIEKSVLVILNKVTKGKLKKLLETDLFVLIFSLTESIKIYVLLKAFVLIYSSSFNVLLVTTIVESFPNN